MTREKYESLPLSTLKALAKSRNMKGISTLRKEALIERMLEEDQKENQKNMEEPAVLKEEKKTETVQDQNQYDQYRRCFFLLLLLHVFFSPFLLSEDLPTCAHYNKKNTQ